MHALWERLECDRVNAAAAPSRGRRDESASAALFDNRALAALAGNALGRRFRHWRGASGRRYIFSVYARFSCPAYEDAALVVAAVEPTGERRVMFIADTGALPELALARAIEETATLACSVEFHVHLLAASREERAAVIADLSPAENQFRRS